MEGASSASGSTMLRFKRSFNEKLSPRSPLSPQSRDGDSIDLAIHASMADNSIRQLFDHVYQMEASDSSPSIRSFTTYGDESKIDAELRLLVGADSEDEIESNFNPGTLKKAEFASKPSPKRKINPGLGPYLLRKARRMISHGGTGNPKKAFELALKAKGFFEKSAGEDKKFTLDYVLCLHILASLHCRSKEYEEAIQMLHKSIELVQEVGSDQRFALAKFTGCMCLGDVYAALGKTDSSMSLHRAGLEIQRAVLGEKDSRFGESCRYVAQACVQELLLDEADELCRMALDTRRESGSGISVEEGLDRRLMGLICESKGNHEGALEHYSLANMAKGNDIATIDFSIGDAYLALARYDEAEVSFNKALNVFKSRKGESRADVGLVLVRLGELNYKVGKLEEAKFYCESALRVYNKPSLGVPYEVIACGLAELSAIYEAMNELKMALKLLRKALRMLHKEGDGIWRKRMVGGLEAQMGVIYFMVGDYNESYSSLKRAILEFRDCGENFSYVYAIALNQLGLTCLRLCALVEAAELLEEAKGIFQRELGPRHPDSLAVCSNLATTYDALGRWDDAIEMLVFVVEGRETKLGTTDPYADGEKRSLEEMLKGSKRGRSKKTRSLVKLLDENAKTATNTRTVLNYCT